MNDSQRSLLAIEIHAQSHPGEPIKPAQTATIGGHVFTVAYHIVNRKAYDELPTPTAQFKMDGRRISRKDAYRALASPGQDLTDRPAQPADAGGLR